MNTSKTNMFPMLSQKITLKYPQIYPKANVKTTEFNSYLETYANDEIMKIRNSLYYATKDIAEDDYSIFINYKKLLLTALVVDKQKDEKNYTIEKIFIKYKKDDEKKIISYTFYASM